MDGFTPIIIIEGFLGFGVVLLLYWMHRREMKAIAKRKAEAEPPMNPLVATRDAAKARVEEARVAILAKLEEEARLAALSPVEPPHDASAPPPAAPPNDPATASPVAQATDSPAEAPVPSEQDALAKASAETANPEGRIQS